MNSEDKITTPAAGTAASAAQSAPSAEPGRTLAMNRRRTVLSAEAAAVRDIQSRSFAGIREALAGPYAGLSEEAFYSGAEDLAHAVSSLVNAVEPEAFPSGGRPPLRGDLPLSGVALAVSQDVDIAGVGSRSAVIDIYLPQSTSPVVGRLIKAGAGLACSSRSSALQGAALPAEPWRPLGVSYLPANPFWPKASPGGADACTAAAVAAGAASAGVIFARRADAVKSACANGVAVFLPSAEAMDAPGATALATLAPAQSYGFIARTAADCARLAAAGAPAETGGKEKPDDGGKSGGASEASEASEASGASAGFSKASKPESGRWHRALAAAADAPVTADLAPKRVRFAVGLLPEGWLKSPEAAAPLHRAFEALQQAFVGRGAEAGIAAGWEPLEAAAIEALSFLAKAGLERYAEPWLSTRETNLPLSIEFIADRLQRAVKAGSKNPSLMKAAAYLQALQSADAFASPWLLRAEDAAKRSSKALLEAALDGADALVVLGLFPGADAAGAPVFGFPLAPAQDPADPNAGAFLGCTVFAAPGRDDAALAAARVIEASRAQIEDAFFGEAPRPSFADAPFVPGADAAQAAHAVPLDEARGAKKAEAAAQIASLKAQLADVAAMLKSRGIEAEPGGGAAEAFRSIERQLETGPIPDQTDAVGEALEAAQAEAEAAAAAVRPSLQAWCAKHPIATPLSAAEVSALQNRSLFWIDAGQEEKVVRAVAAIPEEFRPFALIQMLANAYLHEGRTDDALSALESVRLRERANPEWWGVKAMVLDHAGSAAESAKCVREALKLEPKTRTALFLLVKTGAGAEYSEAEYAEAERTLREVSPFEWQLAVSEARARERHSRFEQELLPKIPLGRFSASLLLLSDGAATKRSIAEAAQTRWSLAIEDLSPQDPDLLRFRVGTMDCSIRFWHERSADPGLVDMARRSAPQSSMLLAVMQHQARISITVEAGASPLLEAALIYSQLLETLVSTADPVAIATLGVLLEPEAVTHGVTPPDYAMLPFWATVHLGAAEELGEKFLYTYGLAALGQPELEMDFNDETEMFSTAVFYALAAQTVMQGLELSESSVVHPPMPNAPSFRFAAGLGRASEGPALRLIDENSPEPVRGDA